MSETDAKVIDPPVEFWALPYREKGQRKLLYSFDGPVSPRYGAYILKSAYEKLQAQAAQFNKERDIWHENRKQMAEAYVELKEKLQTAEAKLEEALAREKRDVKHSLELADGNAELLKWCEKLASMLKLYNTGNGEATRILAEYEAFKNGEK